jgi:probable phosphoglycerate mutase
MPVLERIVAEAHGQTVVIVAHGVVIRVLLTTILDGRGPADFDRYPIDNVAINDLRWDGVRWRAVCLNQRVSEGLDAFAW